MTTQILGIDTQHSAPAGFAPRRFTVEEYHQMIRAGILRDGERIELLEGLVIAMPAMEAPHAVSVRLTTKALDFLLPADWHTRTQLPITLQASEPEPDISVVRGDIRDYATRHPSGSDVGLAIEVADTSLRFDRNVKGPIYAAAGIPEFWIINLNNRTVGVYRDPQPDSPPAKPNYRSRRIFSEAEKLPLTLDGQRAGEVTVSDLLP